MSIFYNDFREEILVGNGFEVKDEVNTIENGAGKAFAIGLDLSGGASTGMVGVVEMAAGAGIHSSNEHEIGGEGGGGFGTRNGDLAIFKGLAESFDDVAREFGKFVKKEDAAVGEGNFAGAEVRTAAEHGGDAGAVVGMAEGSGDGDVAWGLDEGMEFSNFDLLGGAGWREKVCGNFGEESFAGARRSREEKVMMSSEGDDKGAFGDGLALDLIEEREVRS